MKNKIKWGKIIVKGYIATQHNGLEQRKSTKKADLEKKPLLYGGEFSKQELKR